MYSLTIHRAILYIIGCNVRCAPWLRSYHTFYLRRYLDLTAAAVRGRGRC